MTLHHGDCIEVMAAMEPESVDAIVTDPPYGLEFMGKAWDGADGFRRSLNANDAGRDNVFGRTSKTSPEYRTSPMRRRPETDAVNAGMSRQGGRQWQGTDGQKRQARDMRTYGQWCESWAREALRVAKPSAYLLAFGGTRTVHRMTVALEDAGWIIRDMLVWLYLSGFPKSRASLKPSWEPIILARKPGPLRALDIEGCRMVGVPHDAGRDGELSAQMRYTDEGGTNLAATPGPRGGEPLGRWPANVLTVDPDVFAGDWPGMIGVGPETSRVFAIPKANRSDREPVLGGLPVGFAPTMGNGIGGREHDPADTKAYRQNVHPTVKPTDLMRHLVRLVTPTGGVVLDPFLGSGTTALAAEMEGFAWVGIEREEEYVRIAEARLNGTQRGLGLETA